MEELFIDYYWSLDVEARRKYFSSELMNPLRELDPDTFERIVLRTEAVPFDLRYYQDCFENEEAEDDYYSELGHLNAIISRATPRWLKENPRTDMGQLEKCAWGGYDYHPHWEGGYDLDNSMWAYPPKVVYFPLSYIYNEGMDYGQIAFWRLLGFAEAVPLK